MRQLLKLIGEKYPNVSVSFDKDSDDRDILDVQTSETSFYISKRANGNFCVNAEWPGDEKGKRNLNRDDMVKALKNIPGMD